MLFDSMRSSFDRLTRRQVLGGGLSLGIAASTPLAGVAPQVAAAAPQAAAESVRRALDFTKGEDNLYAFCKAWGTLDDAPMFAAHEGVLLALAGNHAPIPLCGYVGCGSLHFHLEENGTARCRGQEAICYTDLRTGEIIDTWTNPFTGELCKVDHGLNRAGSASAGEQGPCLPAKPLILPWRRLGEHRIGSPNAPFILPWKRLGDHYMLCGDRQDPMDGSSIGLPEHFTLFSPAAEIEDRSRPWATMLGSFFRRIAWPPWMRMSRSGIPAALFARSQGYKMASALDHVPEPLRRTVGA